MALPNRKNDVVIEIKDEFPNPIVKNHNWPNALPVELRRIVVSYVLTPDRILEEVKGLDEQFKDDTMEPFREAVKSIQPIFKNETLSKIYSAREKKNGSKKPPEILLDSIMQEVPRESIVDKIDFLLAVYNEDWEREEENSSFSQAKHKIKEIYQNCHMITNDMYQYSGVQFKEYVIGSVNKLLKRLVTDAIVYSYQDSNALTINTIEPVEEKMEDKTIVLAHRLYQQNENSFCTRLGQVGTVLKVLFCLGWAGGLVLALIDDARSPETYPGTLANIGSIIGSIGCFGFCFFTCCLAQILRCHERDQNQARFFETARNRFFQIRRENRLNVIEGHDEKSSNNLAEHLLTPEQQEEYKDDDTSSEDEETLSQPSSP